MILAGGGDTDYNYTIFVKKDSVVDNFFFSICYISSVVVLKRNCFRSKSNAATEYDFFLLFFFISQICSRQLKVYLKIRKPLFD